MVYFCSISKFAASSRAMMISKLDHNIVHWWPVLWIRIRMDPHQIERKDADPDPHQGDKQDPVPHQFADDKPKNMEF